MTGVYLAAVFISVIVVLVVVPRVIFPLKKIEGTFLDRTVAGAVGITAVTVAAMYVFAAIGLLETFAIIAVWAATWWFAKGRFQERGRFRRVVQNFFTWSDMAEAKGIGGAAQEMTGGATARAGWRTRKWLSGVRDRYPGHGAMLVSLGVLAVLAVAAYLRFERALTHAELVPQDSYLALFTTKAVTAGEVLKEGIYPQGVLMWWSMIDRFFIFDTYQLIRFLGPTMAVLELVVLYWVVSRTTRSRAAGLVSLSIFGIYAGNPALFVDWSRQIGAMVQEFALAFAIVSLVYGASYMATHRLADLLLAGGSLFVALTGHTATLVPLAIGYTAILVVGLLTGGWTTRALSRMVVVGIVALLAGHAYFVLGILRGNEIALVFDLYNPTSVETFSSSGAETGPIIVGDAIRNNVVFQIGLASSAIATVIGLMLVAARRRDVGRMLAAFGASTVLLLLVYDFVLVRFGILFRVRMAWVAAVFMVIGIGLGLGAIASLLASMGKVKDLLTERLASGQRLVRSGVEIAAAVLAVIIVAALWPSHHSVAREVSPSGYPQATEVAIDIIDSEDRLTYTVVGVSEQFQEVSYNGWFAEAWVVARDVTFSEARDPAYEVAIPTNRVYFFVEKQVFMGPQSRPFGPTEEYYRNTVKRERIQQRLLLWCDEYRRFHNDMEIIYDDPQLRVYKLERTVDLARAERLPAFKDYTWVPAQYFDDDGDITADRVTPNTALSLEDIDVP